MKTISINKFTKDHVLTVGVKITKQFKMRVYLGIWMIKLAAWVMGMGVKVETGFENPEQ